MPAECVPAEVCTGSGVAQQSVLRAGVEEPSRLDAFLSHTETSELCSACLCWAPERAKPSPAVARWRVAQLCWVVHNSVAGSCSGSPVRERHWRYAKDPFGDEEAAGERDCSGRSALALISGLHDLVLPLPRLASSTREPIAKSCRAALADWECKADQRGCGFKILVTSGAQRHLIHTHTHTRHNTTAQVLAHGLIARPQ